MRFLIHGASGGVGSFARQFARWKGAEVSATASEPSFAFLKSIGSIHHRLQARALRGEAARHRRGCSTRWAETPRRARARPQARRDAHHPDRRDRRGSGAQGGRAGRRFRRGIRRRRPAGDRRPGGARSHQAAHYDRPSARSGAASAGPEQQGKSHGKVVLEVRWSGVRSGPGPPSRFRLRAARSALRFFLRSFSCAGRAVPRGAPPQTRPIRKRHVARVHIGDDRSNPSCVVTSYPSCWPP